MKKLFCTLLALAMLATFCLPALAEADDSLQKIRDKGVLVLGLDESFPPMGFRDEDGNIVGFDIDLATEVCARLGVELVLQPIDWSAKELELNSGNIDCIWNGMTINPDRLASMTISVPYVANAQVIVVPEGSPIETLADLAGKNIGWQAGSSSVDVIADPANAELVASFGGTLEYDEYMTAMLDLDMGGVDALLIDKVVGNYYIEQKGGNYKVLAEELAAEEYGIGFRKADVSLCEAVNEILRAMNEEGRVAEIAAKWFANDVTIIDKADAAE